MGRWFTSQVRARPIEKQESKGRNRDEGKSEQTAQQLYGCTGPGMSMNTSTNHTFNMVNDSCIRQAATRKVKSSEAVKCNSKSATAIRLKKTRGEALSQVSHFKQLRSRASAHVTIHCLVLKGSRARYFNISAKINQRKSTHAWFIIVQGQLAI